MQMKSAKKGNAKTLILLGKRMLGQQSFEDGAGKNADTAVPPLKTQKTSESGVPGRVVGTEVREQPARQGNAGTAELQEEPQKSAAAAGKRTK